MAAKKKINRYKRGRIAEKKVVNHLKELGWKNIRRSKGSRGPADVYARTPSGAKVYIQVKTRTAHPSREEIKRLRELAKKRGGAAAYVHYQKKKFKWKWLGNWA